MLFYVLKLGLSFLGLTSLRLAPCTTSGPLVDLGFHLIINERMAGNELVEGLEVFGRGFGVLLFFCNGDHLLLPFLFAFRFQSGRALADLLQPSGHRGDVQDKAPRPDTVRPEGPQNQELLPHRTTHISRMRTTAAAIAAILYRE